MTDPAYQRDRRARLRAEGKCAQCAAPSATYLCGVCYRRRSPGPLSTPAVRLHRKRKREARLAAILLHPAPVCPVCGDRADGCVCVRRAAYGVRPVKGSPLGAGTRLPEPPEAS
jgi:hypothetical protein